MRRAPGRPKKKRNKSNDEPRNGNVLPRVLNTLTCKKCKKLGRNTSTCKGKSAADREIPKGRNNMQKNKKAKTWNSKEGPSAQRPTETRNELSQCSQAPQTLKNMFGVLIPPFLFSTYLRLDYVWYAYSTTFF
jgi:hypothetical protein